MRHTINNFIKNNLILLFFSVIFMLLFLSLKSTQASSGKYDKVNTFYKVLRLVDENYVSEPEIGSLVEGAISGMLKKLDPHSIYINKDDYQETNESMDGEFEGIGVEFSIIEDYITVITPIVDGPADRAGIQSGDKIIKINGKSAFQITIPEVLKKLKGPKGTEVEVTISRATSDPFNRTLIRDRIPLKSIPTFFIIKDDIGYIKMSSFSKKTFEEFNEAFLTLKSKGMSNLLLDLRNNPGGLLDQAIDLLDMFISSSDTLLFTKGRINGSNSVFRARKDFRDYNKIPIITIINRGSASASEIVSGTFQDLDRGLVIGETSFGKGSVQQHYDLDNESAVRVTVAKYYTPSGRSIQRSYSSDDESYYSNLNVKNRELTDSLKKTLPVYKTKKGRDVFGGGGINPDIHFTDSLSLTKTTLDLVYNPERTLFNYSELIKSDFVNMTFDATIKACDSSLNLKDFYAWLSNSQDEEVLLEDLTKDWSYIKNRIIAEIINKNFGRADYYKVLIMEDKTVQESLKYFDQAKTLLN